MKWAFRFSRSRAPPSDKNGAVCNVLDRWKNCKNSPKCTARNIASLVFFFVSFKLLRFTVRALPVMWVAIKSFLTKILDLFPYLAGKIGWRGKEKNNLATDIIEFGVY